MRVEFKEFKLGDLFEPYLPINKKLDKKERGRYPLICGSGFNNGVDGYTDEEIDVYENELTMSTRGSSGATFYQEGKFVLNNNSMVLKLKEEYPKNKGALIYISTLLNKLPYEGYSSYPTKSGIVKDFIKLPVTEVGEIDWNYMENYMKRIEDESENIIDLLNKVTLNVGGGITLEPYDYSAFKIEELFDIKPSKAYKDLKDDLIISTEGGTPFVTTTKETQGIKGYTTLEPLNDAEMISASDTTDHNAIFYREEGWVGRSHVQGLSPKEHVKMNKYTGLYMVTAFRESARVEGYDYGNKFNRKRMNATVINLPITESGDIDFEYMENYMKLKEEESLQKLELLGLIGR